VQLLPGINWENPLQRHEELRASVRTLRHPAGGASIGRSALPLQNWDTPRKGASRGYDLLIVDHPHMGMHPSPATSC
jgi:hypothetical protein